ncbi:MAG: DUF6371 domain-containing protein [Bacteroidales bacterium]|nr:DUF6371 domain-containing protein [Bacteroidales bacterium]
MNFESSTSLDHQIFKPKETIGTSLIPDIIFNPTVSFSEDINKIANRNNFVKFLINHFGHVTAEFLVKKYFIGSSDKLPFKTIFWQIDKDFDVRTGKIMLYDKNTGNRIKNVSGAFSWIHAKFKISDFTLKQCLFGEHLLSYQENKRKIVAIVESEKTAIIASVYFPNMIWLATGGIHNLQVEKFKVLKNRKIILYPDLNAFVKWSEKAMGLKSIASALKVSNVLELNADQSEKKLGLDLADYLLKFNHKEFVADQAFDDLDNQQLNSASQSNPELKNKSIWQIDSLTQFYNNNKLPDAPLKLDNVQTIINTVKFVKNELIIVKENENNPTYQSYYDRLCLLKEILEKEKLVIN